jgi:hypothetical protein
MYLPTPTLGLTLRVRMLLMMSITLLLLATACGAQDEAKPRPLPEDPQALRPGTYRSEEFEPSLSFRVGKGWSSTSLEASDNLQIAWGERAGLGFGNFRKVYEPTGTASAKLVDAPKDLVGWFQQHPYLRTDEPERVAVGGVEGERFDVVIGDLPDDYRGVCGSDCVDISRFSDGSELFHPSGTKARLIVLEDVGGKTVTMGFSSSASEFDAFALKAPKVVDSVKWTDS